MEQSADNDRMLLGDSSLSTLPCCAPDNLTVELCLWSIYASLLKPILSKVTADLRLLKRAVSY